MKLTRFEYDVIFAILSNELPKFVGLIQKVNVVSREYTGVGMYINLFTASDGVSGYSKTLGTSFYANIEGIEHGIGAILYIDDGLLTMLELSCHGPESFPKTIQTYSIENTDV